jgi:hypothetical protein
MQANRAPRETTQQWVPIPSQKACGSVQVQRRRRAFSPGRITRNGFFRDARRKSEDDGSIGCLGTGAEMATRDQPASAWSRRRSGKRNTCDNPGIFTGLAIGHGAWGQHYDVGHHCLVRFEIWGILKLSETKFTLGGSRRQPANRDVNCS